MGNEHLSAEEIGEAIRAFMTKDCPACETTKMRPEDAFCLDCLDQLPSDLFDAVSDKITYIEAFHPAMKHLKNK